MTAPAPASLSLPYPTVLLTGAAGMIGHVLAPALRPLVRKLVTSDLAAAIAKNGPADAVPCDLADAAGMERLLAGVDAVVHMGGVSYEVDYEPILAANIVGLRNLYEAARKAGTKRIVFASSNHVTGGYEQSDRTSPVDPPRPDGYYGLSKLYGEGMARLYFDRCAIETVCLRIGTATAEDRPPDRRALATWLSHADLIRLVLAALSARDVGFLVAYGCSRNQRRWWNSDEAWRTLGYEPQDDAEVFAPQVQHLVPPAGSPAERKQGGIFVTLGPFNRTPP